MNMKIIVIGSLCLLVPVIYLIYLGNRFLEILRELSVKFNFHENTFFIVFIVVFTVSLCCFMSILLRFGKERKFIKNLERRRKIYEEKRRKIYEENDVYIED